MSDAVRDIMERMVPELRDLEDNNIFPKKEISSIVKKRRNQEYLMHGHGVCRDDYVNAIEYELNLENLRIIRKGKLGLKKVLRSDFSIVKRIHSLFERFIRRFRSDLDVWLRYVDYCVKYQNNDKLSTLFPRLMMFFPKNEELWVRICNWEIGRGYFSNARTLIQRSLRLLPTSKRLWSEYLRLELLFIDHIDARRKALGLKDLSDSSSASASTDQQTIQEISRSLTLPLTDPPTQPSDTPIQVQNGDSDDDDDEGVDESERTSRIDQEVEGMNDQQLMGDQSSNQGANDQPVHGGVDEQPSSSVSQSVVDSFITAHSDDIQREFLQGAIVRVVYSNGVEKLGDEGIIEFIQTLSECYNKHIHAFILNDMMTRHIVHPEVWRAMIELPIKRVVDIRNEDETKRVCLDLSDRLDECVRTAYVALKCVNEDDNVSNVSNAILKAMVSALRCSSSQPTDRMDRLVSECVNRTKGSKEESAAIISASEYFFTALKISDSLDILISHYITHIASHKYFVHMLSLIHSIQQRDPSLLFKYFLPKAPTQSVTHVQSFLEYHLYVQRLAIMQHFTHIPPSSSNAQPPTQQLIHSCQCMLSDSIPSIQHCIDSMSECMKVDDVNDEADNMLIAANCVLVRMKFIRFLITVQSEASLINDLFEETLQNYTEMNDLVSEEWLRYNESVDLDVYGVIIDKILALEPRVSVGPKLLYKIIQKCSSKLLSIVSSSSTSQRNASIKRIEGYFERLVSIEPTNCEHWVNYIEFERNHGKFEDSQAIYIRGRRSVKHLNEYEELLCLRTIGKA